MNGPEVFKFAVNVICLATRQAVKTAGLELSDIELVVPHQANLRIIKSAAKALELPLEKVFINVARTAIPRQPPSLLHCAKPSRKGGSKTETIWFW
jgi:3-oxoacyl-[acyl-carrier-protein] synthase-3